MQIIRDLDGAMAIPDPAIRELVLERIAAIADDIPYDSTVHGFFVVIEEGDTMEALTAQIGFDPLSRTMELLEDCGTCWDCLWVLDDSGFGVELFIQKAPGISAELHFMCQRYADQS